MLLLLLLLLRVNCHALVTECARVMAAASASVVEFEVVFVAEAVNGVASFFVLQLLVMATAFAFGSGSSSSFCAAACHGVVHWCSRQQCEGVRVHVQAAA